MQTIIKTIVKKSKRLLLARASSVKQVSQNLSLKKVNVAFVIRNVERNLYFDNKACDKFL